MEIEQVVEQKTKKVRKPSAWVEYIKAYANVHKMTYGAALSDPECRASYKRHKESELNKMKEEVQQVVERKSKKKVSDTTKPKPKRLKRLKSVVPSEESGQEN